MTKTLFERHRQNPRTKSCLFTTLLDIVWEMFIRLEAYSPSSVSPYNHVDGSNQCKQGATWLPLNHAPHLKRNASWWRHQMETFSALLDICVGNSPVPGEFPAQRPVTQYYGIWCWSLLAPEWTPIFTSQSIVFSLYSIVGVVVTGPPQSTNWSGRAFRPFPASWALMFSLICAQINGWVNNGEAGDLGHHRVHYDVIVMVLVFRNNSW